MEQVRKFYYELCYLYKFLIIFNRKYKIGKIVLLYRKAFKEKTI